MAYIGSSGVPLPVAFSGVRTQSFNGTGSTTTFSLSRAVSAVTDIEVVVNNVQQNPFDGSYNISGTSLVFSEAPSSGTNNVYVVFRDQPVASITDTTAVRKAGDTMTGTLNVVGGNLRAGYAADVSVVIGSGSAVPNTSVDAHILWGNDSAFGGVNGDLIYVPRTSAGARHRFYTGSGTPAQRMMIDELGRVTMPYQPAFHVRGGPTQAGAQVVQYATVQTNIGSHYNSSTHRFTAPVAGKYYFTANALKDSNHADVTLYLRKNGSGMSDPSDNTGSGTYISLTTFAVIEMAVADYVDVYIGNGNIYSGYRNFCGYLVG